ncbi:grpE protein homolog 2, mitochondrial-like isoform X2 [Rhododendron vialii]|uniref:grpE protein homolog 2, mitochondrial-like isoform X2 n=1 Tax=Rhododendron vialii TaxID=182163 RepID=UPI00265E3E88|nr:grpE protein homolog 2, mitochondrial-like isoform X2 [Rhododendron vialii]
MSLSRISSRFPRTILAQLRNSFVISTRHSHPSNQFHSIGEPRSMVVAGQMSLFHHSSLNASAFQQFGFSSVPSPETPEKENSPSANGGSTVESNGATAKASGDTEASEQREVPISGDSDSEEELTMDDLVKLVTEKEELLNVKHKEIEKMQDKVLRTYADMENVMDRARRESENSKKFAIQNFAKSLLDVADNLGRASSVVKDGFSKIDTSKDTSGAVPLLKTLLEGVEMTEKQLIEVFRKFGVVKYDPTNEQFDPNRHNAVFQLPDPSKPPGTVAVVLKAGYMLHERVIRPAEVGVTEAVDNKEAEQGSEA